MRKSQLTFEIQLAENHGNTFLRTVIRRYSEYLDKNPDNQKMQTALLATCIVLCKRYMRIET